MLFTLSSRLQKKKVAAMIVFATEIFSRVYLRVVVCRVVQNGIHASPCIGILLELGQDGLGKLVLNDDRTTRKQTIFD